MVLTLGLMAEPIPEPIPAEVVEGFLPFPGQAREARVVVPIVYDLRDAG